MKNEIIIPVTFGNAYPKPSSLTNLGHILIIVGIGSLIFAALLAAYAPLDFFLPSDETKEVKKNRIGFAAGIPFFSTTILVVLFFAFSPKPAPHPYWVLLLGICSFAVMTNIRYYLFQYFPRESVKVENIKGYEMPPIPIDPNSGIPFC